MNTVAWTLFSINFNEHCCCQTLVSLSKSTYTWWFKRLIPPTLCLKSQIGCPCACGPAYNAMDPDYHIITGVYCNCKWEYHEKMYLLIYELHWENRWRLRLNAHPLSLIKAFSACMRLLKTIALLQRTDGSYHTEHMHRLIYIVNGWRAPKTCYIATWVIYIFT